MKKLLAIGLVYAVLGGTAFAATETLKDGTGATFTILGHTDVSSNFYPNQSMCDAATAANCVSVNASGQITVLLGGTLPAFGSTPAFTISGTLPAFSSTPTVTANAGSGTFTTSDSHFPSTGALSDALSNPTVTGIGGYNLGWDATNTVWRRLQVDAGSGTLKVDVTSATGLAQGSTTSGQTGSLVMGAVTTSAPSYTTAQTNSLSLDTAGNLRVIASGAATAANQTNVQASFGSAVPATGIGVGANSGGNLTAIIQADSSAAINVSTATTTQIVALASSKKIYITSFDVIAGGTGNITFEYGTGSNCGTGTTVLTGAYNLTAQAGIAKGSGLGPVLVVPSGNALCVLTSAAVQMSGSVSYTQF